VIEHRIETVRRARYYTLGAPDARDVWICAHGFGQLAADFAVDFVPIAGAGRLVVVPEGLHRFYLGTDADGSHAQARVGASWMTREDRLTDIADYVDLLDAVHAATVSPGARVTALGFSQGVATITRWIAAGVSRVDRFVAWAGEIPADTELVRLRERLTEPVQLVQGTRDRWADWARRDDAERRLRAAGLEVRPVTFDGGHRLDDGLLARLAGT
jgi:dienelactone hydrolase